MKVRSNVIWVADRKPAVPKYAVEYPRHTTIVIAEADYDPASPVGLPSGDRPPCVYNDGEYIVLDLGDTLPTRGILRLDRAGALSWAAALTTAAEVKGGDGSD